MKKRALGLFLTIAGMFIIILKPLMGITGFAVAGEAFPIVKNIWFILGGLGMMIVGTLMMAGAGMAAEGETRESAPSKLEEDRPYHHKDFKKGVPNPGDIYGFKPYGGSFEKAKKEAQKRSGWKKNPNGGGALYLGEDGLIYSLDYHTHYAPMVNAALTNEEIIKKLHFDVIDPSTHEKIDEVDLEGRALSSKLDHVK